MLFRPTQRSVLVLSAICYAANVMHAYGQGAAVGQQVTPGYQVPSATPGSLPAFFPAYSAGTPIEAQGTCSTTAQTILPAGSATNYLLLNNVSSNSVWVNVAGGTATTGSPSVQLLAGASLTFSAAQGFLPTSNVSCSASGSTNIITVIWR